MGFVVVAESLEMGTAAGTVGEGGGKLLEFGLGGVAGAFSGSDILDEGREQGIVLAVDGHRSLLLLLRLLLLLANGDDNRHGF
jgi:hypothetical protein